MGRFKAPSHTALALLLASVCSSTALAQANANTQPTQKKERWFEIEVIVFSQLGDKSVVTEQFPEQKQDSKMRHRYRAIDLLAPYLHPDLSQIKASLKGCLVENQTIDLSPQYPTKALYEVSDYYLSAPISELKQPVIEPALDETFAESTPVNNNFYEPVESNSYQELATEVTEEVNANHQLIEEIIAEHNQLQLNEAEQNLLTNKLSPRLKLKKLDCLMPEQVFNWQQLLSPKLNENNETIANSDEFPVYEVPPRINGSEPEWQDQPYLISSDSLALKEIAQKLRNSKGFRPLVHLGWRQPGLPKKQAKPVKIYAGDNLKLHYEEQFEAFEVAQLLALDQELDANLNSEQLSPQLSPVLNKEQKTAQLLKRQEQAVLSSLYQNLASPQNRDELISNASLSNTRSNKLQISNELTTKEQLIEPIQPKQDWLLDGLFKVHLNHYLFINADMHIMEKGLDKIDYDPENDKAIRFLQNRRVISGEIHYFDHPYMGMVVQIRRYKRPELTP